jgi:hypothetical protein
MGMRSINARWTHAAIFLYEDWILEAVPIKGVITRSIYQDIPSSVLRIRRDPKLMDAERYKIALCAQRMLSSRYNYSVALHVWLKTSFFPWNSPLDVSHHTVVCSKVFYDSYVEITRQLLQNCGLNDLVTPSHLSATSSLQDVSISWLKVET